MANYSEARKNANKNWDSKNLDRISIAMPKGSKDALKAHAESHGESVNAFINRAIMEVTEMDKMHTAYQRGLLRLLEKMSAALESNDLIESKRLLSELIEDTQNSIESKKAGE